MAHKTWVVGEKLLAADLNNNILSPAVYSFEIDNGSINSSPAFASDWSRAFIRYSTTGYIYKNPDLNKLDPYIGIKKVTTYTNLTNPYTAYLSQVSKFIAVSGTTAYLYNNDDSASGETLATLSGSTLVSAQGAASDGTNVFILDDLGTQTVTGTAVWNSGSTTVTGTGTLFTSEFEVGDTIFIGAGASNTISAIANDLSLTVTSTTGSTYTGAVSRRNLVLKKFTISGTTLTYVSQITIPFRYSTVKTIVVDSSYVYIYGNTFSGGSQILNKIRKMNKTTGALVSDFSLLSTAGVSRNALGVTLDSAGNLRYSTVSVSNYAVESARLRI